MAIDYQGGEVESWTISTGEVFLDEASAKAAEAALQQKNKVAQVDQEKAKADKISKANAQNAATMAAAKTDVQKEQAALSIAGNDNTDIGKVLLAGAQGQQVGAQFFGEGSLGRVSEGFSDARSMALKTKAQKEAANAGKIAQRQATVAQAKSGMSGGAAAFQMAELNNQRAQQQAGISRDIFLADEQQRRQDRVFNLEQAAREKAGRLGTTMGFMQMQQGLLTADKSAQAILNAPTAGAGGGGLISGIFGSLGL